MRSSDSVKKCRDILQTARLTPGEYFVQRELFNPIGLFYGERPQVFKSENLWECVKDLMTKSRMFSYMASNISEKLTFP